MLAGTVVITGARGQLGLELARARPEGITLVAADHAALDITDEAAVRAFMARVRPNFIVNGAAYTAVDRAESDRDAAFRVNALGPRLLARAARQVNARLIQVSTDFVFDGGKSSPYLPDDATAPLGIYGHSKLAGEQAALAETGGQALVIRTAWLYSVHGQNFVKTMLRLMRERPELTVVADQVGSPTAASSLAEAIWRLAAVDAPGGIHHYTDAGVASWFDFACAIRELAAARLAVPLARLVPIRTQDYPTPARRPAYSVLDKTDTYRLTGPARPWREPLAAVVQDLLA